MLKNILKLDDAQQLSKTEQKNISGGGGGRSLCSEYVIICTDNRTYDPCAPITVDNQPC